MAEILKLATEKGVVLPSKNKKEKYFFFGKLLKPEDNDCNVYKLYYDTITVDLWLHSASTTWKGCVVLGENNYEDQALITAENNNPKIVLRDLEKAVRKLTKELMKITKIGNS